MKRDFFSAFVMCIGLLACYLLFWYDNLLRTLLQKFKSESCIMCASSLATYLLLTAAIKKMLFCVLYKNVLNK